MKKFSNFLPVEFYFLLLPAIALFLISSLFLKNIQIDAFGMDPYNVTIGCCMMISLLFFLLYDISIISFDIIHKALSLFFKKNSLDYASKTTSINWKHSLGTLSIILSLIFITYSLSLFTNLIFKIASPIQTAQFSNIALSLDKMIFGTNPGLWLINKFGGTVLEKAFLWAYRNLFLILTLTLLASFFSNKKSFRRLVLSFFISWIISLPLWFSFPALAPDIMFRLDRLNLAKTEDVIAFNSFHPSTQLEQNLKHEENVYLFDQNPAKRLLPISTFPSMHTAWAVDIVYAGMTISPWLGMILIPWAALNCIGAVYILQHFFIDIFSGIFIAIISIFIAEKLLRFDSKYFKDKFNLFSDPH